MKRKRPTYKNIKLVPHKVSDGSTPDCLKTHVEVHIISKGQIGGRTTYRKGLATSSPTRSNTEDFSHVAAPPSTTFDAALDDNMATPSNGKRPTNVR